MKVWVVVYTGPDGHDPGPLECAVFSSEEKALEFIEEHEFDDDWEFNVCEEEVQ